MKKFLKKKKKGKKNKNKKSLQDTSQTRENSSIYNEASKSTAFDKKGGVKERNGEASKTHSFINSSYNNGQGRGCLKKSKVALENKKEWSKEYCSSGKYTCRFEIQIENDNVFEVTKKIIGPKVFA